MDNTLNIQDQTINPNTLEEKIKEITSLAQSTESLTEKLPTLIETLKEEFFCEAITFFALDRENRQLYSITPVSDKMPEIRIDISIKNLAGFVAATGKSLNIKNAYDPKELAQYHPQLSHGGTSDKILDFKTGSMLVVPLPFNRKLIGVLEVINKKEEGAFTSSDLHFAREISPILGVALSKLEKQYTTVIIPQKKEPVQDTEAKSSVAEICAPDQPNSSEMSLHKISQTIHSAKNPDEILIELKDSIAGLFEAEMITIFALDQSKNEIYSKYKSGDHIDEIRLTISPNSIAGWVAMEQQAVNIRNVYNGEELLSIHHRLRFDDSWDKLSGIKTLTVLGHPIIHQGNLMGVLQLINKRGGIPFSAEDESIAQIISETLALAFHNQEKFVQQKPTKFSHLLNNGLISEEELSAAIALSRKNQVDIESILIGKVKVPKKELGKSLEAFYNIPYFGYDSSLIIPQEVLAGLNKNFLSKNYWMPIQIDNSKAIILSNDPTNPDKLENIKQIFPKRHIEFKVGLKTDILEFLDSVMGDDISQLREHKQEEISHLLNALHDEELNTHFEGDENSEETYAISESDSSIVRLVNKILIDAYERSISDIHIEPGIGKENVLIRFRKDGECLDYESIPAIYKQAVISRVKIMAKLDIAERRMPQDGKIKMRYRKKEIEFRVATCPTVGGNEDAVLRILAQSKPLPLDQMNFSQRNLELIRDKTTKPYGLILVVGPTGSGKTTTLHSCLGHINTPKKKIWTAEDPVEITQKGLRQVQTLDKIGFNFSRAMRSFLRGDPDVIMVGEMRDTETASIGLEASLTGHLVFSTLHTNSAPETVTRLLDMGMNPLNFSDALLVIVAQRLVKTLCKTCKESYHPSREEFDILVDEYGKEAFQQLGIEYTSDLTLKKPVGCHICGDSGYAGRTGLHELLEGTQVMKKLISKKAVVEELRNQAIQDGMTTLKQDGIQKIFKGECDLKQVLSVCIM